MRRRPPSPNSALRGVSLLSTAVIAVLIGSLAPQAAAGTVDDGAETALEQPAPAGGASPEEEPTDADDVSTEPAGEEASEAAEEDERASEEGAPADDEQPAEEAPADDETAPEAEPDLGIPTPGAGDYLGSMTIDEADPGAYAESRGLEAYRLNDFRPGNIIADSQMYTSGTMSASAIQKFFDGKVSSCQSGYTCLKDFRQSTATKAPNAYCAGSYQGAKNETAAAIIAKVSKACGVSEKVLIVMLQKEQGLVTHTWPSDWRYDIAMGYACPDDAACDAKYFGFQNQMYHAAYQLQRYTKDSYFSWYPVGKTSQVLWHPNASCGSGAVKIENKATAALYYYTPYQPNRASLAAGYGASSDKCASYGNRNFYNYYTDWFGSAHTPPKPDPDPGIVVNGQIGAKWRELGGANSRLGEATAAKSCGLPDGGCYQRFEGGRIYWTKATGAQPVWGEFLASWRALGSEHSRLGYPTSSTGCWIAGDGCFQTFQGGRIYWKKDTGAHPVWGEFLAEWNSRKNVSGRLGYPTSGVGCWVPGGCFQTFEGGRVSWSKATGANTVWGSIRTTWARLGSEGSRLGYPTGGERCGLPQGGCYQAFEKGRIYWARTTGANPLWGATLTAYRAQGSEHGRLGYPTNTETWGNDGRARQSFQGGQITYNRAEGARVLHRR